MSTSPDINICDAAIYRDGSIMRGLLDRIASVATRPWRIMEVCGGQTFTLSRYRIEELLPSGIEMVHGPGCPVCVTPAPIIDEAVEIAMRPDVILCSFGDMLRVPGSNSSLLRAKAAGADVRILYSPLDSLKIAADNPDSQVVFFAIGFETTTPSYALLAQKAVEAGIANLSLLTSLFTVPAAVEAIKSDSECAVDALLAAGHVCAITGTGQYEALAGKFNMPVVITGFEPADMLLGILTAIEMLESETAGVRNAYSRVVADEGNVTAIRRVAEVFEPCTNEWRGIGTIVNGGMKLRQKYEHLDAHARFNLKTDAVRRTIEHEGCIAGKIMKGVAKPCDCTLFADRCTPASPQGAPMVSGEGVCAAYYRYRL